MFDLVEYVGEPVQVRVGVVAGGGRVRSSAGSARYRCRPKTSESFCARAVDATAAGCGPVSVRPRGAEEMGDGLRGHRLWQVGQVPPAIDRTQQRWSGQSVGQAVRNDLGRVDQVSTEHVGVGMRVAEPRDLGLPVIERRGRFLGGVRIRWEVTRSPSLWMTTRVLVIASRSIDIDTAVAKAHAWGTGLGDDPVELGLLIAL